MSIGPRLRAAVPGRRALDGGLAGACVFLAVLSLNLLGDGLRDASTRIGAETFNHHRHCRA
jgi:uncharacterized RDD family membrane protein YckC